MMRKNNVVPLSVYHSSQKLTLSVDYSPLSKCSATVTAPKTPFDTNSKIKLVLPQAVYSYHVKLL